MANCDVTSVVSELENYVQHTEEWLENFMTAVGWVKDDALRNVEDKVQCSVSPHHFVPVTKFDSHVQSCSQAAKGYSKEDLEKDQSSDYFYEKATTVVPIKLESSVLSGLLSALRMTNVNEAELPQTVERYLQELTPTERLKVYEYCLETARQVGHMTRISDEELLLLGQDLKKKDSGPKSRLEMLAEERDFKRRRQSYKGKSVHTGKKSHLQVLREVILSQMELVKPMFTKDQEDATPSVSGKMEEGEERGDSEFSARPDSRSREVKQRKHHRRSLSRSRSRERDRSQSRQRKHKKKKHKDR